MVLVVLAAPFAAVIRAPATSGPDGESKLRSKSSSESDSVSVGSESVVGNVVKDERREVIGERLAGDCSLRMSLYACGQNRQLV